MFIKPVMELFVKGSITHPYTMLGENYNDKGIPIYGVKRNRKLKGWQKKGKRK
jgi:hypothetical protein